MPASPADSTLYAPLFGDPETARLFSDGVEIRTMLLVEGALARVQGALGLIPAEAANFLDRACREVAIDPASLADETGRDGVPVPALIAAFAKACGAPEHAQYLHLGATSQDIIDSALALRLRAVLDLWDARMGELIAALGELSQDYASLPMAARTYGQVATPTTFGCVVAGWGQPLLAHRRALEAVRGAVLVVSLGGAAGTLAAMGPQGPAVRAALARALDLADPRHSRHADRAGMAALAGWTAGLSGSLGKLGEDLILLTQSGIGEVRISGGGGSSTMPQKQNPIGPSVLVALARQVIGLAGVLQGAGLHRQQRDGASWFTEWLTLPQLCISTGRALALACDLAGRVTPDAAAMARGLKGSRGLIHAEAMTVRLAARMPRSAAQAAVKALCREVETTGVHLAELAERDFPGFDWPTLSDGQGGLGQAPAEATAFADAARHGSGG